VGWVDEGHHLAFFGASTRQAPANFAGAIMDSAECGRRSL